MDGFIVVGNMNAITYKEIFPYFKDNKMWLGYSTPSGFDQPQGDEPKNLAGLTRWFTNLEHSKRKEYIGLVKKYNPTDYPKYDNYDAIEVSKVTDIPKDYDGAIGVPITYLDKYNPNQFEIIGCADADITPSGWKGMSKEFVELYYKQGNTGSYKEGNRLTHFVENGKAKVPYKRLLIRKIKELPTEEEVKNIAE